MHGILVLPLLAWLTSRGNWDESTQRRAVWTGIAIYALVVVAATLVSVFNTA